MKLFTENEKIKITDDGLLLPEKSYFITDFIEVPKNIYENNYICFDILLNIQSDYFYKKKPIEAFIGIQCNNKDYNLPKEQFLMIKNKIFGVVHRENHKYEQITYQNFNSDFDFTPYINDLLTDFVNFKIVFYKKDAKYYIKIGNEYILFHDVDSIHLNDNYPLENLIRITLLNNQNELSCYIKYIKMYYYN